MPPYRIENRPLPALSWSGTTELDEGADGPASGAGRRLIDTGPPTETSDCGEPRTLDDPFLPHRELTVTSQNRARRLTLAQRSLRTR
jgi:hypothetical protein